jgi:phospholipid N-methyltransferase
MEQIIQKRFKKSIPTYNSQAIVQQAMARHLADELSRIQQYFGVVYEFGAGTGLMTKQMVDSFVIQKYIINGNGGFINTNSKKKWTYTPDLLFWKCRIFTYT